MTLTLQDVVIPVKLLINGTSVTNLTTSVTNPTAFNKDDLYICLLGQGPPPRGYKGDIRWTKECYKDCIVLLY